MAGSTYKLVFEGQIGKGRDLNEVKKNLGGLLKREAAAIDGLFSGKTVVIKKNMDHKTAMHYKKVLFKAGAVCEVAEEGGGASLPDLPSAEPVSQEAAVPDKPEMVSCPKCNYKQKSADKCIMCGVMMSEYEGKSAPEPAMVPEVYQPSLPPLAPGVIILTNIEQVPGRRIVEHFGLVSGNTIRAKNVFRDIAAGLKNIIGGELTGYTQLLQESREQAVQRMEDQARQLGANAVVNVRFSTSSVAQGAAELYAYGTAVRVE
jgi:uncharacterized protein YbjQ (UPF0145 family)